VEEQNIHEVPAHTGDGVDAGGNDEKTSRDSFFTVTISDNSTKTTKNRDSKLAETRSTRAKAHEQTRNAKREAAGKG
jgi:hypothetical protein